MSARTPATRRRMPAKAVDVETYSHLDPDSSTRASTCPPSSKDRRNRYEKRSTSAVPIIQPFRIHMPSTTTPSTNRDGDGIHPTKPGRRRDPGPGVHLRFPSRSVPWRTMPRRTPGRQRSTRPLRGPARPIDAPTRTAAKSGRHQPGRKTKMNTKTLDNTANDPWADIAHSDLVN